MKKLLLLAVASLISFNSFSQGIEFFHGTWEEAKAEAKKQDKKIFIDFYTKWCGPCRSIAKEIFPLKSVGDVYNKEFINLKIDAEVGEGPMLAKKYKVKGYPTFTYVNADESELWNGTSVGYGDEEGMLKLANMALGKKVKTWEEYQAEYKAGNRSTEFLEGYISAQLQAKQMPPNDQLKMELWKSYPEAERFKGDNRNTVLWSAQLGNDFYQVMMDNKEKFPELKENEFVVKLISMSLSFVKWDKTKNADDLHVIAKRDFPKVYEQAVEYMRIDELRFSGKNDQFIKEIFAYIDRYGEFEGAGFSIGSAATSAKNLTKKQAKRCLPYYEEGLHMDPPHFYSISSYAYLQYKSGDKKGAQELAKKYTKLTDTFDDSKKMAWSYANMKLMEQGKEPQPQTR